MKKGASTFRAEAKLDIKPSKSQVFLVAQTILAAICLMAGLSFLQNKSDNWWIPFLLGIAILAMTWIGWSKSQKDVDHDTAHATTIETTASSLKVTTDSRIIKDIQGLIQLQRALHVLINRQPIPEPDGMVDSGLQPIAGTKENAKRKVMEINDATQKLTNAIIDLLGLAKSERPLGIEQPLSSEPRSKIIMDTNVADSEENKT